MFVVKDPDTFASQIIPQYFDHNKFSSFARQLNFYGACLTTCADLLFAFSLQTHLTHNKPINPRISQDAVETDSQQ